MAPAIVILEMEVHCDGCARKIEKTIKKMSGVALATASVGSPGTVVVRGTADAAVIQARLKAKIKRDVAIVSITGVEPPPPPPPPQTPVAAASPQQAPPPPAAPPQQAAAPPAAPPQYGDYDYRQHGSGNRFQYSPSYFSDENPNGCSIQ
uniref:HMA domain-containing protein n=1 Tax=Oryza punctata TaxID=4537 RepID=A0A0E0M822_ORYPU